ncbi:hypothetical protein SNEBB_001534 [Seison nebaliae]|nr:hypothetical protein SNEBB_001534 [Seison nebaliae]
MMKDFHRRYPVYSPESLTFLVTFLQKSIRVTDKNVKDVEECIRCLGENVLWGDQNDDQVFIVFLEKNVMQLILKVVEHNIERIALQFLQTFNMIFVNITKTESLYYLLSNNHVNRMIMFKYQFQNEEVIAYYITFLKTLSLKLNENNIQFFLNDKTKDFPLFMESIRFFHHSEQMVRIAVRTSTLHVFLVNHRVCREFIIKYAARPFIANVIWKILVNIQRMIDLVVDDEYLRNREDLEKTASELDDYISYLDDILHNDFHELHEIIMDELEYRIFCSFIFPSIRQCLHFSNNDISQYHKCYISFHILSLFINQFNDISLRSHRRFCDILCSHFFQKDSGMIDKAISGKIHPDNYPVRYYLERPIKLTEIDVKTQIRIDNASNYKCSNTIPQIPISMGSHRAKFSSPVTMVPNGDLEQKAANRIPKEQKENFQERYVLLSAMNLGIYLVDIPSMTDAISLHILIFLHSLYNNRIVIEDERWKRFMLNPIPDLNSNKNRNQIDDDVVIFRGLLFESLHSLLQISMKPEKVRLITLQLVTTIISIICVGGRPYGQETNERMKILPRAYRFVPTKTFDVVKTCYYLMQHNLVEIFHNTEALIELVEYEYDQMTTLMSSLPQLLQDTLLLANCVGQKNLHYGERKSGLSNSAVHSDEFNNYKGKNHHKKNPSKEFLMNVPLSKRHPFVTNSSDDKTRIMFGTFFLLRRLFQTLVDSKEEKLPLTKTNELVKSGDIIDMNDRINKDCYNCEVRRSKRDEKRSIDSIMQDNDMDDVILVIRPKQLLIIKDFVNEINKKDERRAIVKYVALLKDVKVKDDAQNKTIYLQPNVLKADAAGQENAISKELLKYHPQATPLMIATAISAKSSDIFKQLSVEQRQAFGEHTALMRKNSTNDSNEYHVLPDNDEMLMKVLLKFDGVKLSFINQRAAVICDAMQLIKTSIISDRTVKLYQIATILNVDTSSIWQSFVGRNIVDMRDTWQIDYHSHPLIHRHSHELDERTTNTKQQQQQSHHLKIKSRQQHSQRFYQIYPGRISEQCRPSSTNSQGGMTTTVPNSSSFPRHLPSLNQTTTQLSSSNPNLPPHLTTTTCQQIKSNNITTQLSNTNILPSK